MIYYCERCGQPCDATLYEVGVGASCCEEACLLTMDGDLCPECGTDNGMEPRLRRLTPEEELDLAETLSAEANAERTPHERARQNWLNRS